MSLLDQNKPLNEPVGKKVEFGTARRIMKEPSVENEEMKLRSVYRVKEGGNILYDLLAERPPESWISHAQMPTREEHTAFMWRKPYEWWYLLQVGDAYVGDLCVTSLNEIGIHIFAEHQRKGYATMGLKTFLAHHKPLPPIPAKRVGTWLANVSPMNEASAQFFTKMGFQQVQRTYAKR